MGSERLVQHTLAALVLFGSTVVAPLILLLGRQRLGATLLGLALLFAGSSSLLGAGLSLSTFCSNRSPRRWKSLVAVVWILNPCLVLLAGDLLYFEPAVWLSGLPLALALSILCSLPERSEAIRRELAVSSTARVVAAPGGSSQASNDVELESWPQGTEASRARQNSGDEMNSTGGDSEEEARTETTERRVPWVELEVEDAEDLQARDVRSRAMSRLLDIRRALLRAVSVGLVMTGLSFQLGLYALPSRHVSFIGVGAIAWGACALIFLKLYATCTSLGQQRFSQAMMLLMLMLADWISYAHAHGREDGTKKAMLLSLLLFTGTCQSLRAFARLKLRPRWARVLALRRARQRAATVDNELGLPMAPGVPRRVDSSDSDDEQGPGSLPEGFHGALAGILGLTPGGTALQREWLCGARSALVVLSAEGDTVDLESGDAEIATAPEQQVVVPPPPSPPRVVAGENCVEVLPADRLCVVCQEDIKTGEQVRPLPKCGHKFHASCLEGWALVMGEATRCPTCRRPALMRRHGRGAVSVSTLVAAAEDREAREAAERGVQHPAGLRVSGALRRWALREGGGRLEVFEAEEEDEEDEDSVLRGWVPQEVTLTEVAEVRTTTDARTGNEPRTQEFQVSIEKDGVELGLDVLQHDWETLLITRIKEGPLRIWNRRHPSHSVRHGDRIIEVNGQRGDSELLISTIRTERILRIVIRRLVQFRVLIQRANGHRLGLDVTQHPRSLRVLQVSEGPFRRWNAGVDFDFQVQPSDHIVEVNGVHGSSAGLLHEIQESPSRQLQLIVVRRRPPTPSPDATSPECEGPAVESTAEGPESETEEEEG